MTKEHPVSYSQWVDWDYMASKGNIIFDEIIAACDSKHIKKLMRFEYSWNTEIIAQFYATVFFENDKNPRVMHWMTEGQWYEATYDEFA